MANALVVATLGISGRSDLLLSLIAYGASSPAVSGLAMTEDSSQSGAYIATVTAGLTGQFKVQITSSSGGRIIAQGYVYMTDEAIEHIVVSYPNVISPDGRMSVDTSTEDDPSLVADVQTGLSQQGYTETRAALIDSLLTISTGVGSIPVDHNYGGTDNYAYTDPNDSGIDGATVQAYKASDYNNGRRGEAYVVAKSRTDINGRWQTPMMLDPGSYILGYSKQGSVGALEASGPDFFPLVVSGS